MKMCDRCNGMEEVISIEFIGINCTDARHDMHILDGDGKDLCKQCLDLLSDSIRSFMNSKTTRVSCCENSCSK